MKNKKDRTESSYNYQAAVDGGSSIIVASVVSQDPADHKQLQAVIEQLEENSGPLPESTIIPADNGYYWWEKSPLPGRKDWTVIYQIKSRPVK